MHALTLAGARRFPAARRLSCGVLIGASVLLVGCATGPPAVVPAPRVELTGTAGTVTARVEIVDTPETRQRGLMGRTSLPDDGGMLFLWPEDATSAFHMKDTLIPLSIAFISADGVVLRILDMQPCTADPCPVYDPKTSYRMALEVRQGSFTKWGIREGDRARVIR